MPRLHRRREIASRVGNLRGRYVGIWIAARVSAEVILMDRAWGRAPQSHAGEDGNRVIIRKMVADDDEV